MKRKRGITRSQTRYPSYFMIELEKNTVQPWEVELMCQCPQYRLEEDQQEKVETAQDVQ